MTKIAVRLMTPGGCVTRKSAEQESKSAIEQKHEFAEMITETEIFQGNAKRSPHRRSGIGLNLRGRYAGYHERSGKEESSQSTLRPVHLHSSLDERNVCSLLPMCKVQANPLIEEQNI
jgi:hypothetical protein